MKNKIAVIGSLNTDITIKMEKFPERGETVLGSDYHKSQGGKGANQAVAAAKAGADVVFIAKAGDDEFAKEAINGYRSYGINVSHIIMDKNEKTGLALIWVDAKGENSIAVASGANMKLSPEDIGSCTEAIKSADILLVQLEIPLETVIKVVDVAYENNVKVILNPAPAFELPESLLKKISIITPNLPELEKITGMSVKEDKEVEAACRVLKQKGVENVIVTLGKKGSCVFTEKGFEYISAFEVEAVDTTAAGDVFNGALAAALVNKKPLKGAMLFANAAAAISVTKLGAQVSAPSGEQAEKFLEERLLSLTN